MKIGSSDAIRKSLTRFVRSGEVHRIRKGYYLRMNIKVGGPMREPTVEAIARAYARKIAARKVRKILVGV
jgi:hypothetical protein